jgi:hypothetical protein
MREMALRKITVLMIAAYLSITGVAVTAAAVADDAQVGSVQEKGVAFSPDGKLLA